MSEDKLFNVDDIVDNSPLDEETQKRFDDTLICIASIKNKHGHETPKELILESMECPACKEGILVYCISSYNGHIHGRCTKEGCVCWMQ